MGCDNVSAKQTLWNSRQRPFTSRPLTNTRETRRDRNHVCPRRCKWVCNPRDWSARLPQGFGEAAAAELALTKAKSVEMLSFVTPHLQLDSVLDLSLERLRSFDRIGLLLDVDCTLKDHDSETVPPQVVQWLESMRADGLRLCLLSNGSSRRIEPLAKKLQIPFVAKALKPFPFGCRAALRLLDLQPAQTAIVGDQIFADVLAGRLARLYTILVRPTSRAEPVWTRLKRPLERFVLKRLESRDSQPPTNRTDLQPHFNVQFSAPTKTS